MADMTVGQLKEMLDDYGDHMPLKVVKDGRDRDTFFTPVSVGTTHTEAGEMVVQIEIDRPD